MGKFRRSWMLLRTSVQVINGNRKLLLFPLIFMWFACVAIAFFALPIVLWNTGHPYATAEHWQVMAHRWADWRVQGEHVQVTLNPAGYVLMAAAYLVSTFLATFCNVAFYSQILRALDGASVSVSDGFAVAWARLRAIVVWSLFTGLVGLIIRALEERVGIVGRWIIGLLGMAWSVASVFVVPAIILNPKTTNPVAHLKTSASTLKRTWGESLIGFVGIQLGGVLILLMAVVTAVAGLGLTFAFQSAWPFGIAIVLCFFGMLGTMYLLDVANQVYRGALYLYAAKGAPPAPFNQEQMNMAWKEKKSKTSDELEK